MYHIHIKFCYVQNIFCATMVLKNNRYFIIINEIINHNYIEVLYVRPRAEGRLRTCAQDV